ncbi:Dirigent protein [Dillenia turbinata]|uniref:Dirigent protein n=1 Tax=Dillenia turbinata TaxID=194707 RepID=A0AAN8ULZ7_9MAGN
MAQTKHIITFLLLLAIVTFSEAAKAPKTTKMVFYWQDWNSTSGTVTNLPSYKSGFGTIYVADDALTESLDRTSTQVGRAHGMYVTSALDGSDFHILMSFVFTSKEYNGSTLEIQGSDRLFEKYREVSIVSGTGKFRLARGFIMMETIFLDIKANNAIIRVNATILRY